MKLLFSTSKYRWFIIPPYHITIYISRMIKFGLQIYIYLILNWWLKKTLENLNCITIHESHTKLILVHSPIKQKTKFREFRVIRITFFYMMLFFNQCFIFFSLGSPVLVFRMFWIFCHCRSNSAFSSFGPARRVLRPSAILTPYWKAALQSR